MALSASIGVPTFEDSTTISVAAGSSLVFVGANGAGKTRLGVFLDDRLSQTGVEVHRIAAHRSLTLNPDVVPSNFETSTNNLHYGAATGNFNHKSGHRYQGKPETILLNDFDHVLSALYAENNDVSIAYRELNLATPGVLQSAPGTKMDKLKSIWETALPHRELIVLGGNVKTKTKDGIGYSASDMSDGERVIFYVIAQALLAKPDTLLIFDEPELHINKAILANLWDEIESARSDCGFLYITHDVEFASSRHAATKYGRVSPCDK
jgi:ATPase subunit of ABC transporter with duplicated ATPase domains